MIDICYTPYTEASPSSFTSLGTKLYKQTISKGKKAFECTVPECGKIIRYKSDMERHMIVHTESKPYICPDPKCKKTFKREDAMRNHLQSHSAQLEFVCSEPGCGLRFRKKAILQYHYTKTHSTPNYTCENPGCHRTFGTYKGLRKHQGAGCDPDNRASESEEIKVAQSCSGSEDFEFPNKPMDFVDSCFSMGEKSPRPEKHFHFDNVLNDDVSSSDHNYQCLFSETQSSVGLDSDFGGEDFLRSFLKRLNQENLELKGKLDDAVFRLGRDDLTSKS